MIRSRMFLLLAVFTMMMSYSSVSFTATAQPEIIIGLVSYKDILTSVEDGKQIRGQLEKFFQERQALLKKDEDQFKELQQKYEKQRSVLSNDARLKQENEMKQLYMAIQEKTVKYQQELQKMENELKGPILQKLQEVVDTVSKDEKVTMTFEIGSAPLLYVSSKKDLTNQVITAYNKKYPSTATKAPAKK